MKLFNYCLITLATLLSPAVLSSEINSGDTAWILTATALVLFMTLPGLALFYGGLVRARNVLSVLMHCFAVACLASVAWLILVYSLAFGDGGTLNQYIGGLEKVFLNEVTTDTLSGTIPETVFFIFQMTFAIITPALIVGAFPERIKFSAVLLFSGPGSLGFAGKIKILNRLKIEDPKRAKCKQVGRAAEIPMINPK